MLITTIITATVVFLIVTLLLVALLLFAKAKLSSSGPVIIKINGEKELEVEAGSSLLTTLGNAGIFLPSACGGGGTCIQCTCQVHSGGGSILPTEVPNFSRKEIADDMRLGCQVKVKEDMVISIPEEIFGIKYNPEMLIKNKRGYIFTKPMPFEGCLFDTVLSFSSQCNNSNNLQNIRWYVVPGSERRAEEASITQRNTRNTTMFQH